MKGRKIAHKSSRQSRKQVVVQKAEISQQIIQNTKISKIVNHHDPNYHLNHRQKNHLNHLNQSFNYHPNHHSSSSHYCAPLSIFNTTIFYAHHAHHKSLKTQSPSPTSGLQLLQCRQSLEKTWSQHADVVVVQPPARVSQCSTTSQPRISRASQPPKLALPQPRTKNNINTALPHAQHYNTTPATLPLSPPALTHQSIIQLSSKSS